MNLKKNIQLLCIIDSTESQFMQHTGMEKKLKMENVDHIKKQTPFGDYFFAIKDISSKNNQLLNIVFERKTLNDLADSLVKKENEKQCRFYRQIQLMENSHFKQQIYILEGTKIHQSKYQHIKNLKQRLQTAQQILKKKFIVVETKNSIQTLNLFIKFIKHLNKKIFKKKHINFLKINKKRISYENWIQLLHT